MYCLLGQFSGSNVKTNETRQETTLIEESIQINVQKYVMNEVKPNLQFRELKIQNMQTNKRKLEDVLFDMSMSGRYS